MAKVQIRLEVRILCLKSQKQSTFLNFSPCSRPLYSGFIIFIAAIAVTDMKL